MRPRFEDTNYTPPPVKNCAVQECYYNMDEYCHASAITVGSNHPMCDTFIQMSDQHGIPAGNALVGACHQNDCKFNDVLSCQAASINVDYHDHHADCYTYEPIEKLEGTEDAMLAQDTSQAMTEGSTSFRLSGQEERTTAGHG